MLVVNIHKGTSLNRVKGRGAPLVFSWGGGQVLEEDSGYIEEFRVGSVWDLF